MKRNSRGVPIVTVERWSRPLPLSCRPCREKKRRCDRARPCSNCLQRSIACEYAGQDHADGNSGEVGENILSRVPSGAIGHGQTDTLPSTAPSTLQGGQVNLNTKEILSRLHKLEDAVFSRPVPTTQAHTPMTGENTNPTPNFTPFGSHGDHSPRHYPQDGPSIAHLVAHLPPIDQARKLFNHFDLSINPSQRILHIPSTRDLLEKTYQSAHETTEEPSVVNLLLLFGIFAGAAIAWTPELLESLDAAEESAKPAFKTYTHLAMSILDNGRDPIGPSTTALAAISTLAQAVFNSDDALPLKVHMLRQRCRMMAHYMQIHRLDTAKSQEERRLKGCNMIEIEVQRRIWWNMVGSDWLGGFSGNLLDGVYTFHPKHMDVRYPKNADDELITESSEGPDLPLSTPTTMSVYIHRLKLADLCREIVDTMPSVPEESRGPPDYGVILALDTKLRDYLDNLPVFFQMDPASIQQSEHICKERPYIPYQRITMHFSVHARICRLHRPYHLEGSTNSKFAYSRTACIRSAHRTLELRRIMDEQGTSSSFRPERFWVIMQHVFMAALTLATDVSFNPEAPDAEARKEKVMAAYRTFERSQKESSFLVEGIQRNMQALIDTLQKKRGRVPSPHPGEPAAMSSQVPTTRPVVPSESNTLQGPQDMAVAGDVDASFSCQTPQDPNSTSANDGTEIGGWPAENENWYKLWSEFLAAAPDLDATQWTSLLGDIDADFQFGMGLG